VWVKQGYHLSHCPNFRGPLSNTAGYELIAKALREVLKADPRITSYLAAKTIAAEPLVSLGQVTTNAH
jgi:hypothetical protein